jgi:hypothetical protein
MNPYHPALMIKGRVDNSTFGKAAGRFAFVNGGIFKHEMSFINSLSRCREIIEAYRDISAVSSI